MRLSLMRITLILLVFAAQVYGQADLDNLNLDFAGGGARAEGMGKAFIGLSDDVTGGSWNPAGLYHHDSPILGFGGALLSPRGTTNSFFGNSSIEMEHTGSFKNISSMNLIAPIRIKGHKFVGSVSLSRVFDEFTSKSYTSYRTLPSVILKERFSELEVENLDTANVGRWDFFEERQGGMNVFNMGFGTRIFENFSFGLSANIHIGKMVTTSYDIDSLSNVRHIDLSTDQMATFVFDYNTLDSHSFSGMNFNIGFKYSGEKFTAGLLIRTPLSLGVTTERTLDRLLTVNGNIKEDYTYTVLTPKINPPIAKYNLPLMIGTGIGYSVKENLLVALDIEYRGYSGTTVKIRDSLEIGASGNNTEFYTEYDVNQQDSMMWNNVFVLRLGAEYMTETGFGTVPVRAGLGYVPVPSSSLNPGGETSVQNTYNASLGSGIHWEQIHLDIAYTFTKRDKDEVDPVLSEASLSSASSNYFYRNHHVNLTFTGYF